jgi:hypothetical protein
MNTVMMAMARRAQVLLPALAASLLIATGAAWACPICFSGRFVAYGQKIDAADAVVLATPIGESGLYRVLKPIKGPTPIGTLVVDVNPPNPALAVPNRPMLILRNRSSQQWSALGSLAEGQADWLRAFASGSPSSSRPAAGAWPRTLDTTGDLTDEDWAARLALVSANLESSDRLAAEIAYGEIARAPYRLLRNLKGTRQSGEVTAWLANPDLAPRRPAYTLLLGIVGGPADAGQIESQIERHRAIHSADNLAALVAADLEIRGPSRLDDVVEAFLTDKSRDLPEIEGALLALSVQGTADATIPRSRIVSAYRAFIKARPAMAGFVVQDLSDWGEFDAASDLEAAMKSGAIRDPASQHAVLAYLNREPSRLPIASRGAGSDLAP